MEKNWAGQKTWDETNKNGNQFDDQKWVSPGESLQGVLKKKMKTGEKYPVESPQVV